jgi:DNA-binding transcriptional MerR regulator
VSATAKVRERYPFKMKDLCDQTGLARQAIHFYIREGLLPPGHKTGHNMAFYGPEHLERLQLIKRLQHERFLPLKAIKAMLDGRQEHFSDEQQHFLKAVRAELDAMRADVSASEDKLLDPTPLMKAHGVTEEELGQLIEIGIVGAAERDDGSVAVAAEDAWVFDFVGRMRAAGFTAERGFDASHLSLYAEAVDRILERDIELLSERLPGLPPEVAARMLEAGMPLVHEFIARRHARRTNDYLSSI